MNTSKLFEIENPWEVSKKYSGPRGTLQFPENEQLGMKKADLISEPRLAHRDDVKNHNYARTLDALSESRFPLDIQLAYAAAAANLYSDYGLVTAVNIGDQHGTKVMVGFVNDRGTYTSVRIYESQMKQFHIPTIAGYQEQISTDTEEALKRLEAMATHPNQNEKKLQVIDFRLPVDNIGYTKPTSLKLIRYTEGDKTPSLRLAWIPKHETDAGSAVPDMIYAVRQDIENKNSI